MQTSLRKAGKLAAATIVQQFTLPTSPWHAQNYKRAYKSAGKQRPTLFGVGIDNKHEIKQIYASRILNGRYGLQFEYISILK